LDRVTQDGPTDNSVVLTGTERVDGSRRRPAAAETGVARRPAAAVGDNSHLPPTHHQSTRTNAARTVEYTIKRTK